MTLKTVLVTPFLMTILFSAKGQKIDSLKSLLAIKYGVEKADLFFELAGEYLRTGQYEATARAGLEGYAIGVKFNDSLRVVKNGRIAAAALRLAGKLDSCINLYQKILPLSRKDEYSLDHLLILHGMAISYSYTAQYDKALQFNFKALEKERHNRDTAGETIVLNNIGLIYYKLKDYRKAQTYFENCISLKTKANISQDLAIAFINLGLCHAYLGNFLNAARSVRKGLETCKVDCPDGVNINANFAKGLISFSLKEYWDAERYFLKSYALSERGEHTRYQFDNIVYLTQIYLLQNRVNDASNYLRKAEALFRNGETYNLEVLKIYTQFFQMYIKVKNYEKATFYQQKYIQLKDSVYNEQLTINLMKVEADHLERENIAKLAMQEKILTLNNEVIGRQNLLNIFAGLFSISLVIIAVLLVRNNRKNITILDEKIDAHAATIEINKDKLTSSFHERELLIKRTTNDLKKCIATLKGLCAQELGNDVDASFYINRVSVVSTQMDDLIHDLDTKKAGAVASDLNGHE